MRTSHEMPASYRRKRGASLVEATLVLIFAFALIFLLMDLSWALFAKATLQHAVRAGVRYAVTSQTATGLGQVDSIKQIVQGESMGLLSDADMQYVNVSFYTVETGGPGGCDQDGCNAGGNLVMVSVNNYPVAPMAPLLRSSGAVYITVRAGDVMEPSPLKGPPPM